MSCDYKFKFVGTIKGGVSRQREKHSYTFPRAECVAHLAKLKALAEPHPGERELIKILEQALKRPAKKITITITKKAQ